MTGKRWVSSTAAMLAGVAVLTVALTAAPLRAQTPGVDTLVEQDVQRLTATLADANATLDQRTEAARRLLERRTPPARQALNDNLVNLNANGQLAVARALADDLNPDPALINPLLTIVSGRQGELAPALARQLVESAARALGRYDNNFEVLARLMALVRRQPPAPEMVQREVVRALGAFVDKRAAELLINTLQNPQSSSALHAAAADALTEMIGLTDRTPTQRQWNDWWNRLRGLSDADFRNVLLTDRSRSLNLARLHTAQLSSELETALKDRYQTAAPAQRPDLMLRYLRSGEAQVRAIGAAQVIEDAQLNQTIADSTRLQLRTMVGDSSVAVRRGVAVALSKINDLTALQPLLAQLAQETEPQVRAAIAKALGNINDLKAVPALLSLLSDPSDDVVQAAALALADQLGRKMQETDLSLAARAAGELWNAFETRAATAANEELRQALLLALVPLRQDSERKNLQSLLSEQRGESAGIRRLVLRALGDIGKPQSASIIVSQINDRDPAVRLEAVTALGNTHDAPSYVEMLRRRLNPDEETDAAVRDAAWIVLNSVFPSMKVEDLQALADTFKSEPDRQLLVLQAMEPKLMDEKHADDLALTRENIGAALMQKAQAAHDKSDYADAAEAFKAALDYRSNHGGSTVSILNLTEERIKALLKSQQYPESVGFAAERMKADQGNGQTMGAALKSEADELVTRGDYADAMKLIRLAQTMEPPLGPGFLAQLSDIEAEVRRKAPPGVGPTTR